MEGVEMFKDDVIKAQNSYRLCHGSPELVAVDDLVKEAQKWAESIAEKGYLQYSETSGVGENVIFLELNGKQPSGKEVAKFWYEECRHYDFENPRWRKSAKYFTQMIWKGSTDIGIGIAKVKCQDKYVVVAQYRPPGNNNMPGEFRKNVLPPQ